MKSFQFIQVGPVSNDKQPYKRNTVDKHSIESAQARRREGNAKTVEKDVATYRGALAATGSQKRRIPPL